MTHLPTTPPRQVVRHLSLEEMLVWAYRDQLVDRNSERSLEGLEAIADGDHESHGRSADGCAQMIAIGNLGVRVDSSGGSWGASTRCHPDAEALHDAVLSLGWQDAILLMQHARTGDRPERSSVTPRPEPTPVDRRTDDYERAVIDGELRDIKIAVAETLRDRVPVVERRGRRTRVIGHAPGPRFDVKYCPIRWCPFDKSYLDLLNAAFDRWCSALNDLAGALADRAAFRDHVLTSIFADGDA